MNICNNSSLQTEVIVRYQNNQSSTVLEAGQRTTAEKLFQKQGVAVPHYFQLIIKQNGKEIARREEVERNTYIGISHLRNETKVHIHFESNDSPEAQRPTQKMIASIKASFDEFASVLKLQQSQLHRSTRRSAEDLFIFFQCHYPHWVEQGFMRQEQLRQAFEHYFNQPHLQQHPACFC